MTDEMLGIDLNKYRPNLNDDDFDKLVGGGLSFVFNRLSLGQTYIDPTAEKYLAMANDRGLVTGVYHYLKDTEKGDANVDDGAEQAHNFLGALTDLGDNGIDVDFLFLDVEESGVQWGHIVSFVERVRAAGMMRVGLYTRETFYEPRFGNRPDIFDYRWYARYTDDNRWLANWSTPPESEKYRPDVAFWQFSDDFKWGSPDGRESVDGNVFNGSTMKEMLDLSTPSVEVY